MIRFELVFGLLVMAMWLFCLVEVIGSPEGGIRNLGKVPWLLIVLFFPFAGSVAWLAVGRPRGASAGSRQRSRQQPGPQCRAPSSNPEDDGEFVRKVRERAEEQRRAYRASQLRHDRVQDEELRRRSEKHPGDQS